MLDLDPLDHHAAALHRRLGDIRASLHGLRLDWPGLLEAPASTGRHSTGATGSRPPVDAHRLHLATSVPHTLASWALLVMEERGLPGSKLTAGDVVALSRWLDPHAEWLAAHPAGDEAAAEIMSAGRQVRTVVEPSGIRRIDVCPCPVLVPDVCGGLIVATLRPDDDEPDATCDVDASHAWGVAQWRALGAMADQDGEEEWMNATQLASWLSRRHRASVTAVAIRKWNQRHDGFPVPDARSGMWDRHEVAMWFLEHRSATARAA